MSAAAASASFQQNADTTVPLLEQFALDDYQPEEVKLEVALQLAPLGKLMHKQGLSQQEICPDLRSDILLQLMALAVHLLEDDEEKVVEAAQAAILAIAPLLDSGRIQDRLLICLDKLTNCTEHEVRSAVTQLYAQLGPALKDCEGCQNLLQDIFLPKLLEAAEDMDFQVRREMVLGLHTIGPVLTSQDQRDSLLGAYLNMCEDKVWVVRKACADVLPAMSKLAPADMRTTQLLPAFDKLCDDVSHWVQNAALQQLGTFISTLASPIPEGLLQRVTDIPDTEVTGDEAAHLRLATAYTFPAILASAGREQWPLLQPAHQALLQAADPAVRKTLACSLHEIARLLGPDQALQDLGSTIQDLCHDTQADVQEGLVHFFPALLQHLPHAARASFFQTLTQSLSLKSATWRCRIGLADQLDSLSALQGLQPDILSVAMMLCQDDTAAVRSAVARQMGHVVCNLWSYHQTRQGTITPEKQVDQTTGNVNQLAEDLSSMSMTEGADNPMQQIIHAVQSLAAQDAFQLRQQYVKVCYYVAIACRSFEPCTNLFQQYFLQTLLQLAHDKVANVRLGLAQALSKLTELAQLPEVIGVTDMLERDSDLDVASSMAARAANGVQSP
ncbi:hypothetical protein ABBQ38_005030 [Trebouxia sp. C0009 RCD-2024]